MTSILLVIIYIAFISLGLPDGMLGAAWPSMYGEMGVSVASMGLISMIIAGGTIISSFLSDKAIRLLGTGKVMVISVGMTAIALLGFSFSGEYWQLCLWGIPYGLGAGSVDAALNNFVALHYKSRHMSWLHCCWGVGAAVGPYIMGLCLTKGLRWQNGYQMVGMIQVILVIGLFASLPLWKGKQSKGAVDSSKSKSMSLKEVLNLKGAKAVLIAFFAYCSMESTAGIWASSYMVLSRNIDAKAAAKWAAVFYLGITLGRFISGFITEKLGNKNMVRIGEVIALAGAAIIVIPFSNQFALIGLILVGLGCGPIYPCLLHETPRNFGEENSQALMGIQMASAYIGTTFMAPLFGVIAEKISIHLYPWYLMFFIMIMIIMVERVNILHKNK